MRKIAYYKIAVMIVMSVMLWMAAACGTENTAETAVETLKAGTLKTEMLETETLEAETLKTETLETESSETESREIQLSSDDVMTIAEAGFRAIKELSPEDMITCTNIELLYYMGRGEATDAETMCAEITALVNEMDEGYNSLGIAGHYVVIDNIELYDVQPSTVEEIEELNAMLSDDQVLFGGIPDDLYKIEDAYKLQMSYDSMGERRDSYVLVVCVNGHWELDICLAVLRDTYYMLMQMQ